MEESIYRMSVTENFLVLIIIGLWALAVINLARKLERICNPPPIYPNYSTHNKTNLSPSVLHERYPNNLIQPTRSSTNPLVRATSEPTIDASPRATIVIRSPSETFLPTKFPTSEQTPSPSALELGRSNNSVNLLRHSTCRIHAEHTSKKPIPPQQLLCPERIPSIVRRSLLDLHRRALTSNTAPKSSTPRYIVTTTVNQPTIATTNRFPLMKKPYEREYTIDDYEC